MLFFGISPAPPAAVCFDELIGAACVVELPACVACGDGAVVPLDVTPVEVEPLLPTKCFTPPIKPPTAPPIIVPTIGTADPVAAPDVAPELTSETNDGVVAL